MQLPPAAIELPLTQGVIVLVRFYCFQREVAVMLTLESRASRCPCWSSVTFFAALITPTANLLHFSDVASVLPLVRRARSSESINQRAPVRTAPAVAKSKPTVADTRCCRCDVVEVGVVARAQTDQIKSRVDETERRIAIRNRL